MRSGPSTVRTGVALLAVVSFAPCALGQGTTPVEAPPTTTQADTSGAAHSPSVRAPAAPPATAAAPIPTVMPASPGPAPSAEQGPGTAPAVPPSPSPGAPLPGSPPGASGGTTPAPPANIAQATVSPPTDTAGPGAPTKAATVPAMSLAVELAAGMTAGGRFPQSEAARSVEEAVDGTYGLSLWLGSRTLAVGLGVERIGLGKDHYGTNANGETKEASYGADVLSLLGRWYLSDQRPALYLGLALGPSLPTVRATGTRAPDGVFVMPGEAYTCSDDGKVGGAVSGSVGVEFEVATGLSLLADARATGFAMSRSPDAFGGCAPGTGPALVGAARIGASYRFGL
jgi:hypothetical protein